MYTRSLQVFASTLLLCTLAFGLGGCGDDTPAGPPDPPPAYTGPLDWRHEIAMDTKTKLGGCDVGDLRTDVPGREIVAVGEDGSIFVASRRDGVWSHERATQVPGEMIQVAVADLDPDHPGEEIVAVGMEEGPEGADAGGEAWLVWHEGGRWERRSLFKDSALLHGVALTDLMPAEPGLEILLVGFSGKATVLHRGSGDWTAVTAATYEGAGKNAVGYEDGAAIACSDGRIRKLAFDGPTGEWTVRILDEAPAGQSRIGTDGQRLLVARDDGVLALLTRDGRMELHAEDKKLRGAQLADVDPRGESLEAVTAGYEGRLTVLYPEAHDWQPQTLHDEGAALHHVVAEDFLSEGVAAEIVTCGYGGRVIVLYLAPAEDGSE